MPKLNFVMGGQNKRLQAKKKTLWWHILHYCFYIFAELTQKLQWTAGFVCDLLCISTGQPLCLWCVFIYLLSRDTHLLWLLSWHTHKGKGDWLHAQTAVRVICRPPTQQKPLKHLFNLIIRGNKTLTDGRYGMQIYICAQKYTMILKKQLSLFAQWKTQLLLRRKII